MLGVGKLKSTLENIILKVKKKQIKNSRKQAILCKKQNWEENQGKNHYKL